MTGAAAALVLVLGAPAAGAQTNVINTIAGNGTAGFAGDGGPADASQLGSPLAVSVAPDGGYLIVDQGNSRVRRVFPNGTIVTVAGVGSTGFSGDGGPAVLAQLNAPSAAVMTGDGSILIADANNNRIRVVDPNGTISTAAGNGTPAFAGDGGPAASASLSFPADVALTADGGYLIADNDNNSVRYVSPTGLITTLAGSGSPGFSGDGGPAQQAQLNDPAGVAATADGGFLVADTGNNRVRGVDPNGTISTAAGNGNPAFGGDGGPAPAASLNAPVRVAAAPDFGFLIADRFNHRIRRVALDGTISTAAGVGSAGFSGDGGPAPAAELNNPFGVSTTPEGDFLIADTLNQRVRFVDAGAPPPPPGLPPPVIGEKANAVPLEGTVRIKLAEGTSKRAAKALGLAGAGVGFVPLNEARQIPVGSTLDTTRGTVGLTMSAARQSSAVQSGQFRGSQFVLRQSRRNPLTTLALAGGGLNKCKRPRRGKAAAAAKRSRRLFSNARGRFRTRGRNSHATVRGTRWLQRDTCAGTLTRVMAGSVRVRDLTKDRTRTLRSGQRYLARPPARKPKRGRRGGGR
jgi:hypothetical protein